MQQQTPYTNTPPAPPPAASAGGGKPFQKQPWLAALLSFFPGIGNVYNGLYLRGLVFFVGFVTAIYLASEVSPFFGVAVAFVWLFNVLDAYRQAMILNLGGNAEEAVAPRAASSRQEKLFAGALFLIIGAIASIEQYLGWDLDWVFDLWPLVLVAVGIALLVGALRERDGASSAAPSAPAFDYAAPNAAPAPPPASPPAEAEYEAVEDPGTVDEEPTA
jgi:hypothetical protein